MKKRGFTLVELLAVVIIILLISLIAVPGIMALSERIKKNQMLDDAKKMVALAKYQVNRNHEIRVLSSYTFTLDELNINGDIKKDPDGNDYLSGTVKYTNDGNVKRYCVFLDSVKRRIGTSSDNCVLAEGLNNRDIVVNKNDDNSSNNNGNSGSESNSSYISGVDVWVVNLGFNNRVTGFECNDAQCAIDLLVDYIE